MKRTLVSTTTLALACFASTAGAAQPFTEEKAQISGHIGYGFVLDDDNYGPDINPYSFGLGLRGGYTFYPPIYVGGLFDFFIGESDEAGVAPFATVEYSANLWLFQAEVGYDFGVSRSVVLRPKAGIGVTTVNAEACTQGLVVSCGDDSESDFSFAPGLEVPMDLGGLYIAPEARFNIVDDASGFIMAFGIGGAF
jgi:opacity protein-like surface antigen